MITIAHFSLPTQRCFYIYAGPSAPFRLFSAYAEVFPLWERCDLDTLSFLCLRRGVSIHVRVRQLLGGFSLPTQRCFWCDGGILHHAFLFSAYAEVFPPGRRRKTKITPFLCLRRGVSHVALVKRARLGFSLPTQRCFSTPTQRLASAAAFLCLRRGVSIFP